MKAILRCLSDIAEENVLRGILKGALFQKRPLERPGAETHRAETRPCKKAPSFLQNYTRSYKAILVPVLRAGTHGLTAPRSKSFTPGPGIHLIRNGCGLSSIRGNQEALWAAFSIAASTR